MIVTKKERLSREGDIQRWGASEWKLSISVEKFTSISSVWEIQREAKTSELKIVSFWSDLILLI